jgi:hypothetical protein
MRHDLRLVPGGGSREPKDARAEWSEQGNLVTLTQRSWHGQVPPTIDEVLDPVVPHLDPEVSELAEAVVPVFIAGCSRDWLRRRDPAGLWVSLSRAPWEPVGKRRGLSRMGIPEPEWTVQIREHTHRAYYHLHFPPKLVAEPVVAIGLMLGHPSRCQGFRELLTFQRCGDRWSLKKRVERAMSRDQRDVAAQPPGYWERLRRQRIEEGL